MTVHALHVPSPARSALRVAALFMCPAMRLATGIAVFGSTWGCSSIPPGRIAIDSVTLRGVHALDGGDLEGKLATEESPKFLNFFQGFIYDYEIFDRATLQRDLARVERYYQAHGYYAAHARAGRVMTTKNRHVQVEILVEEGKPTVNRGLTIVGIEGLSPLVQAAARTAAQADLIKGAAFEEDQGQKCQDDVLGALHDNGYAYATVARDTYLDIVHRVANTTVVVTPGDLARFGKITIQGLDPDNAGPRPQEIPEAPLRRAIDIFEGQTYSGARIASATQALLDLEVFAAVTIQPDLSHPETRVVPLVVRVEPSKLRQIRFGGGIEFDEIKSEFHVLAGWENHNFLGGLRDFSVDFTPGLVFYPTRADNNVVPDHFFPEEKLRVQLKQPGFIEARTEGFIRPEFNVFPLLVQTSPNPTDPVVGYHELKGAIGVDRTFWKRLYVNLSYDAQVEDPFSYKGGLDSFLSTLVILYPELITKLDFRDNTDHPHEGFYLSNRLQIAGGIFGGGPQDIRVQPEVRTYIPLGPKVTFATRASVGFVFPSNYGDVIENRLNDNVTPGNQAERVKDIQTVLFRGLYSGGPTSNRGFPIRGVSPHGVVPFLNPTTASQQVASSCNVGPPMTVNGMQVITQPDPKDCSIPIGGFTLWEFSNEVRFDIKGPLSGATFCDMGDVSPHVLGQPQAFRFDHLHLSCGVGARYDTPVGPIRLDIGYRIQPLQVLGFANETQAFEHDPSNGFQPTIASIPIAIAIGIGEAY